MIRNLFCIVTAGVWTVFCFPFATAILLFTLDPSASMLITRTWWSPVLMWAGGATLRVIGRENLPDKGPLVFVSNHQSTIDIPALFMAVPFDFRFVAKKVLRHVPFLGWYMRWANFVFIDRSNKKAAIASLDEAGQRIRSGINIMMFAEGTRSDTLEILPFKKGPFALAMNAGVPIVPVTIEGSGRLMPKNSWNITPGEITVSFGKPIDPKAFGDDREGLMRAVRTVVIEQSLAAGGRGGQLDTVVAPAEKQGEA